MCIYIYIYIYTHSVKQVVPPKVLQGDRGHAGPREADVPAPDAGGLRINYDGKCIHMHI